MEEDWKHKSEGIVSFKMPTIQHDTLWHEDIMREGYRLKMLLYTWTSSSTFMIKSNAIGGLMRNW